MEVGKELNMTHFLSLLIRGETREKRSDLLCQK
jgi:hypothetical protein